MQYISGPAFRKFLIKTLPAVFIFRQEGLVLCDGFALRKRCLSSAIFRWTDEFVFGVEKQTVAFEEILCQP
jgi:hypothetical protein